jgi:hypothetical protein
MGSTTIVTLLLFCVAGCGGSEPDPQASDATSPTPTSLFESSSESPRQVAMGRTVKTPRGSLMSVHSITPARRTAAPPDGTEWISADVKFCMTKSLVSRINLTNVRREFALELEDGTLVHPDGSSAEPNERFSDDDLMVGAGDCERGPVVFAVPRGVRPTTFILVTPSGDVEWPLEP